MSSYAQKIKAAILADLQTLVPATLNSAFADDMSKVNPFDRDFPGFPCAVVIAPTVDSSQYEDWRTNLRDYTFWIAVVAKPEMIQKDPASLESLMDAVLNVFDNDVTLQGSAVGGAEPATIQPPGPVNSTSGTTYAVFYVTIKVKALVSANVQ